MTRFNKMTWSDPKHADPRHESQAEEPDMTRMIRSIALTVLAVAVLATAAAAAAPTPPQGTMAFTVSMENPSQHYFHVIFRCEGLGRGSLDFKLPAWSPGYYRIMDYAKNVLNFRAEDGAGRSLPWEKTAKNTWRVDARKSGSAVVVRYDVYAFTPFVAESYLDDAKAFLVPTGVLMHVGGQLRHPVSLTLVPDPAWTTVATGLDPAPSGGAPAAAPPGSAKAFTAPDFDVLYDCPVLMGRQDTIAFEVRGVPHVFAGDNLGALDKARFTADLARMIESAASLVGEIPYTRYAFLAIGPGGGGLEHLNSVALSFTAAGLMSDPGSYKRWLEFVAHEFFHLYNVKRIRPLALGPFDYDRENYTTMLWVSEGFTSYYESLILARAGLIGRDDVFEDMRRAVAAYENVPGHRFQSAAASSFDTWLDFYGRGANASNTTISYYDKGAALGMLLDLAIRHASKNRASLDDVMRALYGKYYKELKRGFTDAEFRSECERAAGTPLGEIFDDYVATTKDIDYAKYLGYAGLEIDTTPRDLPGAWLGASFGSGAGRFGGGGSGPSSPDGGAVISGIEVDSPAQRAGLSAQDEVVAVDGTRVTARSIAQVLETRRPGDKAVLLVARRGKVSEVEVTLGKKTERSFRIKPMANRDPLQSSILKDWLKEK